MPLILPERAYAAWLDRDTPADEIAALLKPSSARGMESWPVSTHVNTPNHEDAPCIVRAG